MERTDRATGIVRLLYFLAGGGAVEKQVEQYEDKGNNPRSAMVKDGKRYPRKKGNGKNSFQDVKNEVHRLNLEHLQ